MGYKEEFGEDGNMHLRDKLALVGVKKGRNKYESWFIDDVCDMKGYNFDFVVLMEQVSREEYLTIKSQLINKQGIIL